MILLSCLFSEYEKRLWGTKRTPFAFTVYPYLMVMFLVVFVTPHMGFVPIHIETLFVIALFFGLVATASLISSRFVESLARTPTKLETFGEKRSAEGVERRISTPEYLLVATILLLFFLPDLIHGPVDTIIKGDLATGGIKGHVMDLGVAYLIIAASQSQGQTIVRSTLILMVVQILVFNQVKYLIIIPLSAAMLFRWVSGKIATWKLVSIIFIGPFVLIMGIYGFFGVTSGPDGVGGTFDFLVKHMVGYLVSGTLGLDQVLVHHRVEWFNWNGIQYAFAPFLNIIRFLFGSGEYFNVVNPLYLMIHEDGVLDSNVFGLFGSLLFRGGWIIALSIAFIYMIPMYFIWRRWQLGESPLRNSAGSWWLAPLLVSWHDPFFIHLSMVEVMIFLWIRGRLR